MEGYIDRERFIKDKREWYCKDCDRRKNTNGKIIYEIGDAPCKSCSVNDMLDELEDYPSADVEKVRHGEWIGIRNRSTFRCSICEKINDNDGDVRCPFCGAKMDGGKENENDKKVL